MVELCRFNLCKLNHFRHKIQIRISPKLKFLPFKKRNSTSTIWSRMLLEVCRMQLVEQIQRWMKLRKSKRKKKLNGIKMCAANFALRSQALKDKEWFGMNALIDVWRTILTGRDKKKLIWMFSKQQMQLKRHFVWILMEPIFLIALPKFLKLLVQTSNLSLIQFKILKLSTLITRIPQLSTIISKLKWFSLWMVKKWVEWNLKCKFLW